MRNKFVYSYSIKIHALGFDELMRSIFCFLLVVEAFSLKKVNMLEDVVVSWQEVRWIWQMRQNFIAQFIQFLKHRLCDVQSGIVVEKNEALSVDQCWLQALQFLVHLFNLLSILLRCNGFTRIQKARVRSDQQWTIKQWPWPCFWFKFGFGKCFRAASWSSHWAGHLQLLYKIHFSSQVTIWLRNGLLLFRRVREDTTSKRQFLKFSGSLWSTYLYIFLTFPMCFKCRITRMVNAEFFSNFLCSCKRSISMTALSWSLSTSNGWLLCSFSRLSSSPLQNFLNHYCIVLYAVLSHPVESGSVQLHGLQPSRLLCPWGFSRPEYWSGLPCPPPGDLPNLGIEPRCPTLQLDSLLSEPPGKPDCNAY